MTKQAERTRIRRGAPRNRSGRSFRLVRMTIVTALLLVCSQLPLVAGRADAASTVAPPSSVTAAILSTGEVWVSWSSVSAATGFVVGWTDQNGPNPSPSFMIPRPVSTTYSFPAPTSCVRAGCRVWVASTDANGQGPWSDQTAYVIGRAPGAPTAVTTAWVGSPTVSWLAPTDLGSPSAGVTYQVEVTNFAGGTTGWTPTPVDTSATSLDLSPYGCSQAGCAVKVFAKNSAGVRGLGSERKVLAGRAPGAATGLTLGWSGPHVVASWTAPADQGVPATPSTYRVEATYFAGGTTGWTTNVDVTGSTSTSYTMAANPFACQQFGCSMRVFAVNPTTGLTGPPTALVTIGQTPPTAVPDAPGSLTASRTSSGVTLAWTAPTSGDPAVSWEIIRDDGRLWIAGGAGTTTTDVACSPWATCSYIVTGVNPSGPGAASPVATVSVIAAPGATNVSTGRTIGGVTLAWTTPSTGEPAVSWEITRNDGMTWNIAGGSTRSADVTCASATACSYNVTGVNVAGPGTVSTPAPVAPIATPPSAVGLTAVRSTGGVTLTWSNPAPGSAVSWEIARDDGVRWFVSGSSTTFDATCPTLATCAYTITGINVAGSGQPTTASVVASAIVAPGAPTALTAVRTAAGVTLTWGLPSSGPVPVSWEIARDDGRYWFVGGSLRATDVSCSRLVACSFTVTGVNVAGPGAATPAVSVPAIAPPGAPASVTATRSTAGVTLVWAAPSSGGAPVSWEIARDDGRRWFIGGSSTTTADVSCGPWAACSFTVTGVNVAGAGVASSSVAVAKQRPAAPISASVTVGSGAVVVSWVPPAGIAASSYRVEFDSGQNVTTPSSPVTVTCPLVGPCGFTVYAANPGGESLAGTRATFVTGPPSAPTPGSPQFNGATGTTTVSFTPAATTPGTVQTGFRVYWSALPPGVSTGLPLVFDQVLPAGATSATFVCPFQALFTFGVQATCNVAVTAFNQYGESDAPLSAVSFAPTRSAQNLFGSRRWDQRAGDPVSLATGNLTDTWADLEAPQGTWGAGWLRTYNSLNPAVGVLGVGWSTLIDTRLSANPDGSYTFRDIDGREVVFLPDGTGGWVRPEEVPAELSVTASARVLSWQAGDVWTFDLNGRLVSQVGWEGQTLTYGYTGAQVMTITASSGYTLSLGYTPSGLLAQVSTSTGRSLAYGYNPSGAMVSVTLDGAVRSTITPDPNGRLGRLADGSGVVLMDNTFDGAGRVTGQTMAGGSPVTLAYDTTDPVLNVTTVTEPATSAVARFEYDKGGRLLRSVDPAGAVTTAQYDIRGNRTATATRAGATTQATYDSAGRVMQSVSSTIGQTTMTYDTAGRVTAQTDALNRTTTFTYDGSERLPLTVTGPDGTVTTFNIVNGLTVSRTDADGIVTSYAYDTSRRLASTSDGLGHSTAMTYDNAGRVLTLTDATGGVTTNTYSPAGWLLTQKNPLNQTRSYTYDGAGRVLTLTDPTGAVTTNTYDTGGRIATVKDPVGVITSYAYDTAGRLATVTRPGPATTTYGYDRLNRVVSVTDPLGRITRYAYDTNGNRTTVTSPTGAVTTTGYDSADRPVTVTDPLGRITRNTYDAFGHLTASVDAAGQQTTRTYDLLDRVKTTTDPLGAVTTTSYTLAGRPKTVADPAGIVTTTTYDLAGRTAKTTGPTGDTTVGYDNVGRVTSTSSPGGLIASATYNLAGQQLTSIDPAGVVTTNTYTTRGELATTTHTGAGTVTYGYNLDGTLAQVTDANGAITKYGYDARKNRVTRTNALNGIDTETFDAADQLLSAKDPLNRTLTYTYDPAGRVASVTDPTSRATSFGYDAAGQLASKTVLNGSTYNYTYDLLGRRISAAIGTQAWSSTWNPVGELTSQADPAGRISRWSYDQAGRQTATTIPDGTTTSFAYDTASRLKTITPGETVADTFTGTTLDANKWTGTVAAGGTVTVAANALALTTSTTAGSTATATSKTAAVGDADLVFTYNPVSTTPANRADLTVEERKPTAGAYQLVVPSSGGTATVIAKKTTSTTLGTFAIPGAGRRAVRFQVQGTAIRARVWQADQPEPVAWTVQYTNTTVTGTGTIAIGVVRNAGTNTIAVDDVRITNPTTAPAALATYSYNNDNQYTTVALNGGSRSWTYTTGRLTGYSQTLGTATTSTSLAYDTSGRIKTETVGTAATNYTYDPADQLKTITPATGSATTYTYDALGRRNSVKVGTAAATTNTYDAASQLTAAGTTTFTYDSAGRRLNETTGTTVTSLTYDPQGRLANTTRGTTTVTRGYNPDDDLTTVTQAATVTAIDWDPTSGLPQPTSLGGTPVNRGPDGYLTTKTGPTLANVGRDIHGSVTTGSVARGATYSPFGAPAGTATFTPKLGYRGEIIIDALVDLRARTYDPARGVFVSRDPIDGTAGRTTVANAYHYSDNNPLQRTDPTGQSSNGDPLYGWTDDAYGHRRDTYSGQILVDGKWMNYGLFLKVQQAQTKSEAQQATAAADRLDTIGVTGTIIATVGGGLAGIGCATLAAESGPVGAGAAAGVCAGYVNRLLTGLAAGDSVYDSMSSAGDPAAVLRDGTIGALIGGVISVGGNIGPELAELLPNASAAASSPGASGLAATVTAEIQAAEIQTVNATEAASVPGAAQLADEVAGATGGTVKQLSNGYSITVPSGSRGIVVRVMEEGGGRTNYYRVSVPGKEAFTVDGVASVDRALTHIDIGSSSLDEILRIIKAAGG